MQQHPGRASTLPLNSLLHAEHAGWTRLHLAACLDLHEQLDCGFVGMLSIKPHHDREHHLCGLRVTACMAQWSGRILKLGRS